VEIKETINSIILPSNLKEHQEFTVPIGQWNSLEAKDKAMFLGNNRLYIVRLNKEKDKIISVVLRKHSNSTLIKN